MTEKSYNPQDELEQAVSRRLARLGGMPVDTGGLDRMLLAKLPPNPQSTLRLWIRPLRAVAAVLVVALAIAGVLVFSGGGPVQASPSMMAQMHRDLVAERVAVMKVDSIDEAGQMLARHLQGDPNLPQAPDAHVMACCMREVKDKKVACVLLRSDNVPVTLTIARAADMKLPRSPTVVRNGLKYHVEKIEELTMVMTEREGRWICLVSELSADALIQIAAKLQF